MRALARSGERRFLREGFASVLALALALAATLGPGAVPVAGQHVPSLAELRQDDRGVHAGQASAGSPHDRRLLYQSGWTVRAGAHDAPASVADSEPVAGTLRVLVIPALFADSPEPVFSSDHLRAALFDGPSAQGTIGDLYHEASRGALTVAGTVVPWYRAGLTLAEVRGGDFADGAPPRTGEYLLEAIAAVDQSLDLGQFDNDGPDGVPNSGDDDGTVDSVFFLYHEVGAHCGGTGPWPHFGGLAPWNGDVPYASDDARPDGAPVEVNGYVLSTAVDCAGQDIGAMPVASHELGHVLGLPDFYHPIEGSQPTERRWVLGCWDLMAAGAWGCGPSDQVSGNFGPTGFAPWSKERLGWLEVQEVGSVLHEEFVLEPVQSSGRVLKLPLDSTGTESFVVEYRTRMGFDRHLPASGVLIYHWDEDGRRWPDPDSAQTYLFSLVEADGNRTLQRTHPQGGNRGEAGDAWAADGRPASFSNATQPRALRASGLPSTVTLHDIRIEGGAARLRISTAEQTTVIGADELPPGQVREPYEQRLAVGGGAPPYILSSHPELPLGITVAVSGEELVVSGTPVSTGDYEGDVVIRDARGFRTPSPFGLLVASLGLAVDRLVAPFLGSEALPPSEEDSEILDNDGNRNGQYDVGDLRAQLVGR